MLRIGLYAGSFDPVTAGHEDIIRRAAGLCDRLVVTVMYNISKRGEFSVEERVALLRRVTENIPNVVVGSWDGLMIDYVKQIGAQFVVRGVRGITDLEAEQNLAQINSRLMPGLETVILMTKPDLACISSSAVREAAAFGADYSTFIPACIIDDIKSHYMQNGRKGSQ